VRGEVFKKPSAERVLAGGTWSLLAGFLAGLLPFVIVTLGSRVYGPAGFEHYTTGWALTAMAELAAMGLGSTYVRHVSEAHERDPEEAKVVAANATLFMVVLGLLLSAVFFSLIFLLVHDPGDRLAFSLIAASLPVIYLKDSLASMLGTMHRFDYASLVLLLANIATLLVGGFLLLFFRAPEYAPLLPLTVVGFTIFALLSTIHFFRKTSPYPLRSLFDLSLLDRRVLSKFLRSSIWITLSNLTAYGLTLQTSIFLVKVMIQDRGLVGIYGVAAQYAWSMILVTSMAGPLVPELARAKEREDKPLMEESTKAVMKWTFGMGMLAIVLYLVVAELALFTFNGPDYVGGRVPLMLLNTGMVLYGMSTVFSQILVGLGRERKAGLVFGFSHLFFILLSPVLVHRLCLNSVPLSLLLSSVVAAALLLRSALSVLGVGCDWKLISRTTLIGIFSAGVCLALIPRWTVFAGSAQALLPMIGWGAAACGIYFLLLVFWGQYDDSDYRMIEKTLGSFHPALVPLSQTATGVMRKIASFNPFLKRS
jgi:O-antigen/teichoic acid export membrane protein